MTTRKGIAGVIAMAAAGVLALVSTAGAAAIKVTNTNDSEAPLAGDSGRATPLRSHSPRVRAREKR